MTDNSAMALARSSKFCSEQSRLGGEPLVGTGVHPRANILIAWPRPQWTFSPRIASGMPEPLQMAAQAAFKRGWRVNLIDRQSARSAERHQIFLFPSQQQLFVTTEELVDVLNALLDPSATAEQIQAQLHNVIEEPIKPIRHRVILCCTHAKHDRCCAKFGYATYKALDAANNDRLIAEQSSFDIWESSHLGGCRLAAAVLIFPEMNKYGRLNPDQAADFLQTESAGRIYFPSYRGRSDLDTAAQAAELAGREHWQVSEAGVNINVEALPIEPSLYVGDKVAKPEPAALDVDYREYQLTQAHAGHPPLRVRCHKEIFTGYGSCEDLLDENTAPNQRVAWVCEVV